MIFEYISGGNGWEPTIKLPTDYETIIEFTRYDGWVVWICKINDTTDIIKGTIK